MVIMMSNYNFVPLIIVIIGIIGIVGVWNYRYNSAYNLGLFDGYVEGNLTGATNGYDTGFNIGLKDGHNEGFTKVKELGKIDGYTPGYKEGYSNGESIGYKEGFEEGNSTGLYDGYIDGIVSGSEECNLRDPTLKEALLFIEMDDTDKIAESDANYSNAYLLNHIKKNAFDHGFRCLWVRVKTVGLEGSLSFCAFNTTDRGLVVFSYRLDVFLDLVVGKPCYDRAVWEVPSFDDTITYIEFTP